MSKYIDADKMLEEYRHSIYDTTDLAEMLDNMPSADVREVKHGRWEEDRQNMWRCSVCKAGNNYAYSWGEGHTKLQDKYCPNCGAKMDEEEAEEE